MHFVSFLNIYFTSYSLRSLCKLLISPLFLRYKKFRDAKTLAGRTAEEKKAIFGHVVSSSTPTSTVTSSPAPVVKSESTSSFSELESKDKKSKKEKKDKKEKKRKRSDGDD